MSNKGKRHNKRWLISRLKTSGSKRKYVIDGDYSENRNSKKNKNWDDLPNFEGMGQSFKFFNNKVNYGLLIRFLRGKNGTNWNVVQKEVSERIPSNLNEYKDCLKWFVADLIEKRENELWDKREQKYLRLNPNEPYDFNIHTSKEFYVDPDSNLLVKIADFPSKRKIKERSTEELPKEFKYEKSRVMYIEDKSSGLEGNARIGRVYFSKTGKTLYYNGRRFQSLKGMGFKANYVDIDKGDEFWISGPKKDRNDRLYGGQLGVEVDEDVKEEYFKIINGDQQR